MRGHQPLIAMRRKGAKPAEFVEVLAQAMPRGDWAAREFAHGRVFVEPSDNPATLDLRFLVGCDVMVDGADPNTVQALHDALVRAKARRVISSCGGVRNGRGYIDFILDTQEVLTWHA